MRNYYTEKETKELLKNIVILVDTREQENTHILKFLDKKKIGYKSKALDFGDYSFYIPKNEGMDITRDIYFDKDIVIERKGSLSELAGNLTNGRERFEKELIRKKDAKMSLLIEDGSWWDINQETYKSKYNRNSFLATLHAYRVRYNISIDFISKELAGQFVFSTFYYYFREQLLNFNPSEVG